MKPYPPNQAPWIFLDNLNLLIHEAGHLLFSFTGQFIHILSGSMLQVLIPMLFTAYFWRTRQSAGIGFGLFWVGNNLINVSYYIRDAEHKLLPLLGGHGSLHDWQWLLVELGWYHQASLIAMIVKILGVMVILGSVGYLIAIAINRSGELRLRH